MSQLLYQTYSGDPKCEMKAIAIQPDQFPFVATGLICKPCVKPVNPSSSSSSSSSGGG